MKMKSREFQLTLQQIKIRAWLFCPEDSFRGLRPVVLFCHGIPGGSPDPSDRGYLDMVEELALDGYCCVTFNFRGCGLSEGSIDMRGWYDDLAAVADKVIDTPGIDPAAVHCVAFSAGGAIAAKFASREKHLKSLLLMATPADFRDILPDDPGLLRQHFRKIGVIRDEHFPPDLSSWHQDFLALEPAGWLPFRLTPPGRHRARGQGRDGSARARTQALCRCVSSQEDHHGGGGNPSLEKGSKDCPHHQGLAEKGCRIKNRGSL